MSLTLRDAQHLCWKNFRKINDNLNPEQGKRWNEFVMIADLVENAGQVASAVKKLGGFENGGELGTKEILAVRLSDMLFAALSGLFPLRSQLPAECLIAWRFFPFPRFHLD